MVAFRKVFPVLAIGAFLLGTATTASAQTTGGSPMVCDSNAGVPPVVRAEGHTELVGDIVIQCRGGNPTLGATTANFQLFLNTNVTSRLLANGMSEALLMIDEPETPANPGALCPSPNAQSNSAPQVTSSPVQSRVLGLPVGGLLGTGTGPTNCNSFNAANTSVQTGTYNVFRGQPANAANGTANAAVVWTGIPIVPPGTNVRTIRITNIRANAATVPASASLVPSQIFAFISISGSQSLALNNPQQAVAFVLPGLQFAVTGCNNSGGAGTFLQCNSQNGALFSNPSSEGPGNQNIFGLRFREGFQTAFKTRVEVNQLASIPGVVYNTESGFVRNGDAVLGNVGLANTATRLAARFNNLPEGIRLFVTTTSNANAGTPTTQANAILITSDANGAGGSVDVGVTGTTSLACGTGSSQTASELTITGTGTGRTAMAVWEVTAANSATIDNLFFLVGVAYNANTPSNLPGLGTSSVTGSFAPFYAANSNAGQASASLPIPRFIDNATPVNTFTINQCVTNLLFPFVTNQAGFDTGIAISNTSLAPTSFGNRAQSGTCTINYYGNSGANPAPSPDESGVVNAGAQLLFVLSSGGAGVDAVPGFQGYIIAQCRFQYAHGFAFVTDGPIGQARVAEGYLALVMDNSVGSRTGSFSETLGH